MDNKESFEQQQAALFSSLAAIEADCWQRIVKGSVYLKMNFTSLLPVQFAVQESTFGLLYCVKFGRIKNNYLFIQISEAVK